ncbi:MAG: glycosyltransferase family 4 protein [Ferruginibacter sp.]|nr:glycosyltransferase family 4 protein [Ferruginibacter sp.]
MRIMILTPGLPLNLDNIRGGVHSAVSNLLKGFQNEDADVRVLSFSREVKEDTKIVISDRIEVHYVYEGPFPYHSMNYLLAGPKIVKKHIKDFKPDIIHFQEGSSFMFIRVKGLNKIKYLQTIHGMSFAEAKRKKKLKDKLTWYFNGVLQLSMLPRNVIHLSNFSVRLFSKRKIAHGAVIPNAIVQNYFDIPLKLNTSNTLLYMGIIDNNKNLLFLLQAMKDLLKAGKPFTLNVLGDFSNDMYKEIITTYIQENELEPYIKFQGWVSQPAVMKFIEHSDILVVSSKHESLPMVIAESMAAGKVVAASDVGGIPEMIEHNVNGYLFNLASPGELVNILERLYDNDEKIREISSRARASAQKYNCNNVATKTLEFYKKCV